VTIPSLQVLRILAKVARVESLVDSYAGYRAALRSRCSANFTPSLPPPLSMQWLWDRGGTTYECIECLAALLTNQEGNDAALSRCFCENEREQPSVA
jgi:hypothetical protein